MSRNDDIQDNSRAGSDGPSSQKPRKRRRPVSPELREVLEMLTSLEAELLKKPVPAR